MKKRFPEEQIIGFLKEADAVWPMDFGTDALSNGRRLKCLLFADNFTKEVIDIVVDRGFVGLYVARMLDQAAHFCGYSKAVRTDARPEFTRHVLDQWAYADGVTLKLIQAGKPTQNAYIKSFNGKFRDECLNEHWSGGRIASIALLQ